jgi:hypothetical protein
MDSSGRGASSEGRNVSGESARLRAALNREAARRPMRQHPAMPLAAEPQLLAGVPDLAAVRRRAWLIPKGPFVAMGRLALALVGISGVLLLGLLLAAAVALVQMHFQGR